MISRKVALICITGLALLMLNCGGGALPAGDGFSNPSSGSGTPGQIGGQAPITVVVSPSSANIAPGGQLKLSATVTNATNSSVMWAVSGIPGGNATVGTISASGTYLAPPTAPTPNSVLITATSVEDSTKQGSAVIVISAPASTVTVSASPAAVTLQTGASTVFAAVVTGATSSAVSWRVNGVPGGDAVSGMITAVGVYTAPAAVPTPATVTIEAVSVADPSAVGTAVVTVIQRVQVSLSPTSVMVGTFFSQQFVATVTGTTNTQVAWSINGIPGGDINTVGSVDSTGLYTAPATVPFPNNVVTLTAASVADPSATALASISIVNTPGVTVVITPSTSSVEVNQTLVLFVTTTGLFKDQPPSPQVTWHVNQLPGGTAQFGTVVPTPCPVPVAANVVCGLYTAPTAVPVPNTVIITAFNVTDTSASGTATVLVTAPTVVAVSVAPATTAVQVNTSRQFTASVTGTANQNVTWSVSGSTCVGAACGTITAGGLYTAPGAVPAGGTVMVTATSQADSTAVATAIVTITASAPAISVSVTPQSPMVRVNNQLQFTASVSGTSVQTVTWSASCIGGGCGTINANGLYTAPANVPVTTVTIAATSTQAPNPQGTSILTVLPTATISMNPITPVSVPVGLGVQFFVTVTGHSNTNVNFAVNGIPGGNSSVGTITTSGLYIAPAVAPPTPGTVTVTATSVVDPSLVATTVVSITTPITVSVSPSTPSIATGAMQQFTATVTGTMTTTVTWAVSGIAGGNATVGTIDATGLYTGPASLLLPQTFAITATSAVAPNPVGNATVTVTPPIVVTISPTNPSLQVGLTQQFTSNVTGTANTAVTWSVSGTSCSGAACGTITGNGLYTAPTSVPAGTVTVTAISQAQATPVISASTAVTITPGPAVSVSPSAPSINAGGTQQFTATVTNAPTTTVTWSVNGVAGGNATVGTIDNTAGPTNGLYTSPNGLTATTTFNISAQSTSAPSAVGNATVNVVVPISVAVSPPMASVRVNTSQTFMATVSGTANQSVTWTVGGACGSNCGSINSAGVYLAPGTVPGGSVTITATSVADNTKTGTATVTVTQAVAVTVSPVMSSVTVNTTQQFTATVTGTTITAVTWSVSCATPPCGMIDAAGLFTAPAAVPSGTVTVFATSTDGTSTVGSASVTILPLITVTVAPAAAALTVSQGQQFTATVTGTANTAVTWSVDPDAAGPAPPITGGNATIGTVNSNGAYSAPMAVPTPSTVLVVATSVNDPTKSASASVTINPVPTGVFVSVFPRNVSLPVGRVQQFKAHVIRTNNQSVTWSVNGVVGGNATFGTIDAFGAYSPPSIVPTLPNITITASSTVVAAAATVNARIVPSVSVSPSSVKVGINTTQQFTATVAGVSNANVVWAVDGIVGGNLGIGTISPTGLYTAPASIPRPGTFSVTATSVADSSAQSAATMTVLGRALLVGPSNAQVMPGAHLAFVSSTHLLPAPGAGGTPLNWTVNGITGGNAAVGTINQAGVYIAPPTPQAVAIEATSTVDPTRKATNNVTVTLPTGASPVSLLSTMVKVRPYDIVAAATPPLNVPVAGNQYASWQVVVEGRAEDLTGVNLTVSNFNDGLGNSIPSSNAVIYLQKYVNAFYPSRTQTDIGEFPDPLIPKVDPFVNETRNAFPFTVNRISPAYKQPPRAGGDTVNTGLGAGRAVSGGIYTGSTVKHFVIQMDRSGSIGSATFRWSNDGGATFVASNVPTSTTPSPLSDGVTVTFQSGNLSGVTDFLVGNTFWIWAGPNRNQPVWIDLFVPGNTPPGTYNGNVTVMRAGKSNVTLAVTIVVRTYVLPVTSAVPSFFGMNWNHLVNAHFLTPSGPQTLTLGQLYGTACLINRITCDTASAFPPSFTFDATTGAVLTASYTTYDQATSPLANGTITPHGEQLTTVRMPRAGITTSEEYFAAENIANTFTMRGWRSRLFDFSFDEPGTPMDFDAAMRRTSIVRSVDENLRAAVTTDISKANFNLIGYINRWTPQYITLETKEFLDGPNPSARALYDPLLLPPPVGRGDELWWYPSCGNHSCTGTGASPRFDNYNTFTWDVPALLNRSWGLMAASPYRIQGVLYQDTVLAYSRFFNMSLPRVDVWESTYYLGGNGEGTLFYPGRPSDIGGTTHIPVESLRLKQIRDAMVDLELANFLIARGDGPFVESTIIGTENNEYIYNVEVGPFLGASRSILTQAASPPLPPVVSVPAAGGFYIDPETNNRVYRVTDRSVCTRGGHHFYSYWPVWNANGTHMIVECLTWIGAPQNSSTAILVRDSDLAILGNAHQGLNSLNTGKVGWSWVDPNIAYSYGTGARNGQLVRFNPFTHTETTLVNVQGFITAFGRTVTGMTLAYISFDDRFFLLECTTSGGAKVLLVYNSTVAPPGAPANTPGVIMGQLDLGQFPFYDEAVFTKPDTSGTTHVWVRADDSTNQPQSFRYNLNFTGRIRIAEGAHHAHGRIPNGSGGFITVAVKASSNRNCPAGSASGVPGQPWKPTAVVLNESIDTTGAGPNDDPLASQMLKLACNVPGQHNLDHFSWNNVQTDRFFISTNSYSGFATDPLAFVILRVRLNFGPPGTILSDNIDVLARHRSEDKYGYYAKPRVACNQQGTRCMFESTMTLQTNNVDTQEHVYIVEFQP